ncbi:cation:proton antiporter subunit C [Candidatus Anaplasma sp. TIGMIC]|uniref:cation:proton antiporter subunit C n=1 Tax=Candidatus Anaplasma sp. TIGMIC TaxID=3020713 RepID=UPI00232B7444|nr:cation:proton antiporter subunit C [Candidatus Anaplasma sp. TIGMIC]MDB1135020.1 cation:proton antiporter subunit C [Candidatus Anaplasma sp. TIGMIC]
MSYFIVSQVNYIVSAFLASIGIFTVVVGSNRIKQLMGLGIFQTSALLFYVSLGYVSESRVPILASDDVDAVLSYSNPLPSVLMLTAIVVGVATMAVGLAMVIRIEKFS